MNDIDQVGRTALFISEIRSHEAKLAAPLFEDRYAPLFFVPEIAEALGLLAARIPVFPATIRVRTRWFDDLVSRALDSATRQVVILGAGLDCRALRLGRPGVTFYEVDRASLLAFKAACLASAGHPVAAVTVGADYTAPGLLDALVARGFDPARRTLVLWEGNTYYLPLSLVEDVLRTLAGAARDIRIALDYFGPEVIESRSRSPGMNEAVPYLKRMGAPWQCGIDDIRVLAAQSGLRVEEDSRVDSLFARLISNQDLGTDSATECFMAVLASGEAMAASASPGLAG